MDCLLDSEGREEGQQVLRDFPALLAEAFAEARSEDGEVGPLLLGALDGLPRTPWMEKTGKQRMGTTGGALGILQDSDAARLCDELLQLMEASAADWTLLWRRLADVAQDWDELMEGGRLLEPLQGSFYLPLSPELEAAWSRWLLRWLTRLQGEGDCEEVAQQMRRVNPKYVPRNWMLMEAYEAAEAGNFQVAQRLQQIFASPYEEHPEDEARYFRLAPVEMRTRLAVVLAAVADSHPNKVLSQKECEEPECLANLDAQKRSPPKKAKQHSLLQLKTSLSKENWLAAAVVLPPEDEDDLSP
ncbi:Protein adenylyltransferase SelO [Durusdinium trenchii]|uniref:Selenoprotein O n=1 Tax=Durusdinium trenchii TaxID=1381693 RepID=A0ABP0J7Z6_9DINO